MGDKTSMTRAELELTQRIQLHFPDGIPPYVIHAWNTCKKDILAARLKEFFLSSSFHALLEEKVVTSIFTDEESFDASRHFILNTSGSDVKISSLNEKFVELFIGKVEKTKKRTKLRCYQMKQSLTDSAIITELGGEKCAERKLFEMFGLMKMQPDGGIGILNNRGCANIFYIKDVNRRLWTVICIWNNGGWNISAYPTYSSVPWESHHFVFV